VTQPPYGPQHPAPGQPDYQVTWYDGAAAPAAPVDDPTAPEEPRRSRTGRKVAIGAAAAGVVLLGGAGYAVAAYLSGGGAQPEEALPADTIGVLKLDLDPAAGQKAAVASLMGKFPSLDGAGDIRQSAVDGLLDFSGTRLDFDEDVDPWLGDRMAVALVPDEESDAGMAPVLVLAVDDQQAMGDTLRELGDDLGYGHAVRDDFLLLAETQEIADRVADEDSRLSESEHYRSDLAALDGDQIAVAWADLSALQQHLGTTLEDDGIVTLDETFADLSGRIVYGLHAESDALEVVGMDFTASDVGPGARSTEPTRLVQDLPEDTVLAVSMSGLGDVLVDRWDEIEASGMLEGVEEMFPDLELPDDVQTVFGSDFLLAMRGDLEDPQFGIRAVTDDPERATGILKGFNYAFDLGIRTVPADVDDGYVLATDTTTARALAGDNPGLGDTDAFRAAVPGVDDATYVLYVDMQSVLDQFPNGSGFTKSDYEAVQALGMTSTPTDQGSRVVLRVTVD
jgi:hypothetical protein